MEKINKVCLDTCTIRTLIHEENGYPEILKGIVEKYNVIFKIAETAWAELIDDFYDGSIKIDEWKIKRDRINSFIFQDCPIEEQGYNLSVEMNTFKERKEKVGIYNKDFWRKCWQLVMRLEKIEDLSEKIKFLNGFKPYTIQIRPEFIKKVFEDGRSEWYNYFEQVKIMADSDSKFERIIEIYIKEFEKIYSIDKMIDSIHALSWYTYLHLQKTPYNPKSKKRKNDSIDFSFLQILTKPSFFCTEDDKFQSFVKISKAPNANNIKSIQELIDYYK